MAIVSKHSPKEYMKSLRYYMESHFDFGQERFTGFFLWRLFYVTHHAGFEWNRRITNQKNAAMGFVTKCGDGCKVHYLRFRSVMCPLVFWPCYGLLLLVAMMDYTDVPQLTRFIIATVAMLIATPIYTFIECLSQRSEDGRKALVSLLMDPSDPLANYRKIP